MIQHQFQGLTVNIFNDPTYAFGSQDNTHQYLRHIFGVGGKDYAASKHGIKLFDADKEVYSCIIIASGGATGIHQNSTFLDNDRLLVCCSNTLFCLGLPTLNLLWQTKVDTATCFQVLKLKNDYLVHGELEISRIDYNGLIKWQFGGADIFVSIGHADSFQLKEDHILLTDFGNKMYKIDFNGKLI